MKDIESVASDPARYQRWLDVRYAYNLSRMNARLYGRVSRGLDFVQIAGGSAAVIGASANYPSVAVAAGVVVALTGVLALVTQPSARSARFEAHARRAVDLELVADQVPQAELERRLVELQTGAPEGEIDSLDQPAYNATVRQNGRADAVVPTTRWQRFVAALA